MNDNSEIETEVVHADSNLTISQDGNSISVTLEMIGLPEMVMKRIHEVGGALTLPLIKAVMESLSGPHSKIVNADVIEHTFKNDVSRKVH